MKNFYVIFILILFCTTANAANDTGWIEYAPNSFINTTLKNLAINPAMKQISYYSKQTNLSKTIKGQPIDTLVTLSIVDCSGIIKTKDVSELYYNQDKLISRVYLDKATLWEYHSPDSVYYQNLQTFCSKNFKK